MEIKGGDAQSWVTVPLSVLSWNSKQDKGVFLLSFILWLLWLVELHLLWMQEDSRFKWSVGHSGTWGRNCKNWLSMSGCHLAFSSTSGSQDFGEIKTFSLEKGVYFNCHETIAKHSKSG